MRKSLSALALTAIIALPAHASLFNVSVNAGGINQTYGFGKAEDSIDILSLNEIQSRIIASGGTFDINTSAASVNIDYRGVDLGASYEANSSALSFNIAALGISETFDGATREESLDMLKDWLKGDGGNAVNNLNKALVASSPFDPLAGNPNSLMSSMVDNAFDFANGPGAVGDQGTENTLDLSISFGQYSIAGKDVNSYRLPLSYTARFDNKYMEGHRLQIRMPVTYTEIDGAAKSYTVGTGLAYSFPVPFIKGLELTPAVDYGLMASKDLYSAAIMRSFSLTGRYDFTLFGQDLTISSSYADLSTESVEYDDIKVDADLSNSALTNGIMWRTKTPGNFNLQAFAKDTRFSGDKLYSERTSEVGMAIGHPKAAIFGNPIYVGASYMFTDRSEIDGFKLNMGASF